MIYNIEYIRNKTKFNNISINLRNKGLNCGLFDNVLISTMDMILHGSKQGKRFAEKNIKNYSEERIDIIINIFEELGYTVLLDKSSNKDKALWCLKFIW
jgi:hypothetical protein